MRRPPCLSVDATLGGARVVYVIIPCMSESGKKTLIRGGTIVDGTGAAAFVGDVLLVGETIEAVFPAAAGGAPVIPDAETFDASGCLVTPGFIDAHAHSDAYLILEPGAPSKITQGITTEVNGQCGGSIAPRFGEARLSSDWASLLGERLTWRTLAEYRAVLAAAKPAINSIQFVGHNTLRASVVGYAGRAATVDELKRMIYLLEEAFDEGARGLSTGLIYQPGKYATREEVTALARVAAKKGGFYATHMRSEGDELLESIDEVIALARETGIRAEISHLKTSGRANWHKLDAALAKIEGAMKEGFLLGADRYPFCAAGTDLDVLLPDWAGEGAAPAEMARLADPATRARIIGELNALGGDASLRRGEGRLTTSIADAGCVAPQSVAPQEPSRDYWASVMIGGTWAAANKRHCGRTVAEILADGEFSSPGELICDILEKDACRTGAFFFGMSEENLDKLMATKWIVPGSDASLRAPWGPLGADHPHPRAYGTMPEFYRRARAQGVSREEAIARMTSVPADRFGIKNRGRLVKGAFADVVVWKEDAFACTATYSTPHRFSTGVKAVWVNGGRSLVNERGQPSQRTGRFLERG